jgi:uncharacterized protein (DUF2237 family)
MRPPHAFAVLLLAAQYEGPFFSTSTTGRHHHRHHAQAMSLSPSPSPSTCSEVGVGGAECQQTTATGARNVLGTPLLPCSAAGMAVTGYDRTGSCNAHSTDRGSHNVCLDISTGGFVGGGNFCALTGQSDWCSQTDACHEDALRVDCPRQSWCVCEWAFARVLDRVAGCDGLAAGAVKCEATNEVVLRHYEQSASSSPSHRAALECLRQKCGLPAAAAGRRL